ncbi:MAG TPA: hypothetical protein VGW77_34440 [Candidatus Binatia bacterium]|nr:hypothetical protein [Candidatus Binatia bacterium]
MRPAGVQISLLLPTRGRAALVRRLFDSLVQTTTDLRRLEVVLYIDEDDGESREISHPELSLIRIVGRPGETMGNMNRACYEASHGPYVMLINDDAVFRTVGWDTRVLEAASHFPDEIALLYGDDLDQGEAVPTFPIMSRTMCDVLGEICPRGYRNLHIESHLLDIFKQLARMGHDRIRYLHDVIVEHMHYVVGKAAVDATYIKKSQRDDDLLFIALDDERAFKAKLLAEHIEAGYNYRSKGTESGYASRQAIGPGQRVGLIALLKRMFLSS